MNANPSSLRRAAIAVEADGAKRDEVALRAFFRLVELPDNHELLATLPVILDAIEDFVLAQE